jgi:hypothetical protein
MKELGKKQENNRLHCDNQISIHIAKKSSFHSNTKNIQIRYHFIRFVLEDGKLKLEIIYTRWNLVDMLTYVVTIEKLSSYSVLVGLQA